MPTEEGRALMIDIATEELAHVEIINTMIKQLTQGATLEEIKFAGFEPYYTEHGLGIYPSDSMGSPFNATAMASTGDVKADIYEDMAGEQKARAVYENLINLADDPDVLAPLHFLRQREVVHFNRFKELLETYKREYKK
jgi:spore coat protein JC